MGASPPDIPIIDNKEPLIDIRLAGGILYGPPPECPETEPHYCLVREGVYRRLLKVQSALPAGLFLRLYEGLRSLAVQSQLFDEELDRVKRRMPSLNAAESFGEAKKLVSPVRQFDGSINVPPHSTGGAVDIEIVDEQGRVIDFGMEIKDWVHVSPDLISPLPVGLSALATSNRQLLASKMQTAGFVLYEHEWWHFSYGDRYWAKATGAAHAIYGGCIP
jgi:D-alanyl-D-alanine dipeptidase